MSRVIYTTDTFLEKQFHNPNFSYFVQFPLLIKVALSAKIVNFCYPSDMIDALIKHVSVTYKCYEMYAHRGKKVQLIVTNATLIYVLQLVNLKLIVKKISVFLLKCHTFCFIFKYIFYVRYNFDILFVGLVEIPILVGFKSRCTL